MMKTDSEMHRSLQTDLYLTSKLETEYILKTIILENGIWSGELDTELPV